MRKTVTVVWLEGLRRLPEDLVHTAGEEHLFMGV